MMNNLETCKADIVEIFLSVQGEGLNIGERQIFIRFLGCNLDCTFCDTRLNNQDNSSCRVEIPSEYEHFRNVPNPLSAQTVLDILRKYNEFQSLYHSISFTGGEPLLKVDFLKLLLPEIYKDKSLPPIYLETNGTLPQALSYLINWIDYISMDIKLPSSAGSPPELLEKHKEFLQIAIQTNVFVKIVITPNTKIEEIHIASKLIKDINQDITLILQPVTSLNSTFTSL